MTPVAQSFASEIVGSSQGFCDKLSQSIKDLKVRLQTRYERHLPGKSALIRRILDEAESVAWCTPFPHLFLPDLAEVRLSQFVHAA